jgi:predicted RNase H-like HicB family nuclease
MASLTLSAVLNREDSGYVALCPELDIASQGESIDEALANLKEAVEFFLKRRAQTKSKLGLSAQHFSLTLK